MLIFLESLEKAKFFLIFRICKLDGGSVLVLKTDMFIPWYVNSQNVLCGPMLSS